MKLNIYKTIKEFYRKYRGFSGTSINYEDAKIILKDDPTCELIDVRSPQEYREGNLKQSINIPLYDINKKIENIVPNKENQIIVYCQSGYRSKKAMEILYKKGYTKVYNISGGLDNL